MGPQSLNARPDHATNLLSIGLISIVIAFVILAVPAYQAWATGENDSSSNQTSSQETWEERNDGWHYRTSDGKWVTRDWVWYKDHWYYLNNQGAMVSGWQKIDNQWYYFDADGIMQTGWHWLGGYWYYFPASGAMATGWLKDGNAWYYLNLAREGVLGSMRTDDLVSGGETYHFAASGRWIAGGSTEALTAAVDNISSDWYAAVSNGGSLRQATYDQINGDMLAIWNRGHDVGFVLVDLASGRTISANPYASFYAASTIKGPYVCAIATYDSRVNSYRGTIQNTISWSSNTDYTQLRSAFGSSAMSSYMSAASVSFFNPATTWVDMRPADLSKLWIRNYEFFNSNGNADWVKPLFRHSSTSFIDDALGSDYAVYSKAGWIWSGGRYFVWNDGALIEDGGHPYVLAVMSSAAASDHQLLVNLVKDINTAHQELIAS